MGYLVTRNWRYGSVSDPKRLLKGWKIAGRPDNMTEAEFQKAIDLGVLVAV